MGSRDAQWGPREGSEWGPKWGILGYFRGGSYNEVLMIWGMSDFGGIPEIDQFWDIRISGLIGFGQIWPILTYSGMVLQREGAYFGPPLGGVWEAPGRMGSGVSGPKGHSHRYLRIPDPVRFHAIQDLQYPVFRGIQSEVPNKTFARARVRGIYYLGYLRMGSYLGSSEEGPDTSLDS